MRNIVKKPRIKFNASRLIWISRNKIGMLRIDDQRIAKINYAILARMILKFNVRA